MLDALVRPRPPRPPRGVVPTIALIGAGPRGAVLLERLAASLDELHPHGALRIEVVDPYRPGAGRVWTRRQSYELCMNTFAGEVTLFTDDATTPSGPHVLGPTLYQWCRLVVDGESRVPIGDEERARFAEHPVDADVRADEALMAEMRAILPWSHPSRVLFGVYLSWCFDRTVATLPKRVGVVHRAASVLSVEQNESGYAFALDDGSTLRADTAVFSLGWLPSRFGSRDLELQQQALAAGLTWIQPGSPREQDYDAIPDGAEVIVRGLGMGFFDAMALLTIGRGGEFVPDAPRRAPLAAGRIESKSRTRLRYEPSGREPFLAVGSRRGVPFRSKPQYDELPPRSLQRFLAAEQFPLRERPLDFVEDVLPFVLRDATDAYYTTLARTRPGAFAVSARDFEQMLAEHDVRSAAWAEFIARAVPDGALRLDLDELIEPARGVYGSAHDFESWVRAYIEEDLTEGRRGRTSALKAAAWSIGSSRGILAKVVTARGLDGQSHVTDFLAYLNLGGLLGSGPPAFRMEQLLALHDAGIVRFVGPEMRVAVDAEARRFVASSARVANSEVSGTVLLDAWMQMPNAAATTDPLIASLLEAGLARIYSIPSVDGTSYRTGSIEIDAATSRLVDPSGELSRGLFFLGIPAEDVRGGSIQSPLPHTNSPFLTDADAVAREILATIPLTSTRKKKR